MNSADGVVIRLVNQPLDFLLYIYYSNYMSGINTHYKPDVLVTYFSRVPPETAVGVNHMVPPPSLGLGRASQIAEGLGGVRKSGKGKGPELISSPWGQVQLDWCLSATQAVFCSLGSAILCPKSTLSMFAANRTLMAVWGGNVSS
jgi:hypothetical protein